LSLVDKYLIRRWSLFPTKDNVKKTCLWIKHVKKRLKWLRSSIIHFGFQKKFSRQLRGCMWKENLQFARIGKDKRIRLVRIHWTSTQNGSQSTSLPPWIFLIKVSPLPSHVHNNLPFCHCPHQSYTTN
jgi:hypothetical protein